MFEFQNIYHIFLFQNQVHANIGGGRDNIIENNIMYNATSWSMQFDERGTTHRFDADLYRALKVLWFIFSIKLRAMHQSLQ